MQNREQLVALLEQAQSLNKTAQRDLGRVAIRFVSSGKDSASGDDEFDIGMARTTLGVEGRARSTCLHGTLWLPHAVRQTNGGLLITATEPLDKVVRFWGKEAEPRHGTRGSRSEAGAGDALL